MQKLTQKIVRDYLRFLGATFKRMDGDYRLAVGQGDKRQEYFANDLDDVIETARVMLGGHECIEQAEEYLKACDVWIQAPRHV